MGLVGMAAAPLRAPGGEVIGTLAISTAEPRAFEADDLDLLQGLADQAAIALTNSNLLARVTHEEARFRGPRPDDARRHLARRRRRRLHVHGRLGCSAVRLADREDRRRALRLPDPSRLDADRPRGVPGRRPRPGPRSSGSRWSWSGATARRSPPRSRPPASSRTAPGSAPRARSATSRSGARLERELRESEERYRYLVQNAPDLIWSIGADARITFLSDAVERLTGFLPEDLLGKHFGALVHEIVAATSPSSTGPPRSRRRRRRSAAGSTSSIATGRRCPPSSSRSPASTRPAQFTGANGSVRDMRDRDRLERDLRASEDRYRNLASSSPDMVFATDAEGRYTFLSDRASTMLGWDLETQHRAPSSSSSSRRAGRPRRPPATRRSSPTRRPSTRSAWTSSTARASPRELEINVLGKVEDGALVGINGVARDISERLRLERELSQSEERYRFLVQNSPDIVFSTDAEGRFTFLSDAVERVLGYRSQDVIGQHFSTLVDQTTMPLAGNRWAELVADPDREQQANLVLRGVDGRHRAGRRAGHRDQGRRGVRRDPGRDPRRQRPGPARERAAPPGRRAGRRRGARAPRPGAARLGHPGAVLHDARDALGRDAARPRPGRGPRAADPAARAAAGGAGRDARADLRAAAGQPRAGRPGARAQDPRAALQGRLGLPIVVESDLADRLPLPAEEVLYRIAQEALHNVVKHAAARQVRVEVRRHEGGVRLRVEDDGKGFDPDGVPDGHLGLAGMRARSERVGARFSCTSKPGEGTTIEVVMDADVLAGLAAATGIPRAASALDAAPIRDG